jgi:hypothetical protein
VLDAFTESCVNVVGMARMEVRSAQHCLRQEEPAAAGRRAPDHSPQDGEEAVNANEQT